MPSSKKILSQVFGCAAGCYKGAPAPNASMSGVVVMIACK
jgi:hypothetical protein